MNDVPFWGAKPLSILGGEDLMAMFTFYSDDSGTDASSEWAIAASIMAPVEQWEKFVEEWKEVAAEENFEVFHMGKFVARKPLLMHLISNWIKFQALISIMTSRRCEI